MFCNYPQQVRNWFLDLVFPVQCIGCGKFGNYVCRGCLRTIPVKKNFECIGCKRNTPFGQTCYLCAKTNCVDQLLIVADYKNPLVEKILKFLKYKFISDLAEPTTLLAKKYLKWLTLEKKFNVFEGGNPRAQRAATPEHSKGSSGRMTEQSSYDGPLLVPIPLHSRRLNWRGFNQSELFAKNLADTFQMEIVSDVIGRMVNTVPQADIKDREERLKNLSGIFKILNKEKIVGRDVLLVDDICTTGATLNECARVLKESGASKITALVIARG
jgi:predicted amidophosphoribosyltransferase